jgi:Caspase domain
LIDTVANKWIKFVRRWNDAGKGTYTDIRLIPRNLILDLKPLPNGNLFVLNNYPELVMLDPEGKELWRNESGNNDLYAGLNIDHLKVSHGGSAIGFTPQFNDPMSFDISERQLKTEKSIYPSAIDSMKGIKISNWIDGKLPTWNGDTLKFIKYCRGVDFSSSGEEIVFGTEYELFKLDKNGKIIWSVIPPAGLWTVNISGNDKTIVATLSDGTIRWFRMEDGKEILSFYLHTDQKRWVLFTPSGYYDASPGAEDFLGWHVNNGMEKTPSFYPVSRYREQFYRPDVIDAVLETYYESSAIKLANQRAGKKESPSDAVDIVKNLPPVVHVHSPSNGSVATKNKLSIIYSVDSPPHVPVHSIKILLNGRPASIERTIKNVDSGFQKVEVSIPEEDCTITLLAENEYGTSPESNLYIKWNPENNSKKQNEVKPNLYVLSIGISNYDKEGYRLTLAAKDAEDFSSAALNQKGKLYGEVHMRKLTDKNATKINILNALQWIQEKTTKNDIAMIFFAGHGVNDNNGIYYMLPVEADIRSLRSSCINFEEVKQTQSTIEGKVIVFIDACHSGNVMGGTGNYINGLINLLTSTVKGAGAITLTSSTGKETSLENPSWNNGAFTKALVDGMNGAASVGEEKEITYTSLALYISRQVKKLTGDKQHPTLVPTPNTPDFPIALAR